MGDNASDSYQVPEIVKNRQLAVVSGLTFAVLVGALGTALYFAKYAGSGYNMNSPAAQMAANRRLQKVGDVSLQITDAGGGAPKTGEEAYKAVCAACHGTGAAGAPKFGDAAEWGPRIAQGESVLLKHALEGFKGSKGVMPPKGGSSLSDDEVHRAMVYMANAGGAKFAEPKAGAAAGAASGAASAAGGASAAAAPAASGAAGTTTAAAGNVGEALFKQTCQACHGAGVAGAPKFGDKAAWAPRIAQGEDTLFKHAIGGFQGKSGVMPPKGGSTASDDDVKAAVRYMVAAGK